MPYVFSTSLPSHESAPSQCQSTVCVRSFSTPSTTCALGRSNKRPNHGIDRYRELTVRSGQVDFRPSISTYKLLNFRMIYVDFHRLQVVHQQCLGYILQVEKQPINANFILLETAISNAESPRLRGCWNSMYGIVCQKINSWQYIGYSLVYVLSSCMCMTSQK